MKGGTLKGWKVREEKTIPNFGNRAALNLFRLLGL
jgi:hypothetical protein